MLDRLKVDIPFRRLIIIPLILKYFVLFEPDMSFLQ
jgi:hypothetical protein